MRSENEWLLLSTDFVRQEVREAIGWSGEERGSC